jgi:hypothetical protein
MVLTAGRGTCTVTAAVGDALRSPFRADEVGEGEAVFGDIGSDPVVTDAVVGQSLGRAIVFAGF